MISKLSFCLLLWEHFVVLFIVALRARIIYNKVEELNSSGITILHTAFFKELVHYPS